MTIIAIWLYVSWVDSYEKQMMKSIGKPYEGKLHVRFDEGGTDSLNNLVHLLYY